MPKQDIFNISTTDDSRGKEIPSKQMEEEDPSKITAEKEKGFPNIPSILCSLCVYNLRTPESWNMVPFNMVPFIPGQSQCTCAITADSELNVRATKYVDLGDTVCGRGKDVVEH